ncbi:MAG: hypothetical protein IT258_21630 [Saprospiraceae bacterium]|nr:hypothetical protein [Saprospiraceae bacterium]
MKKHVLLLLGLSICLAHSVSISAQTDASPKRELGFRMSGIDFNGFNAFSGIYKKELAENKYRRISGSFGNLNFDKRRAFAGFNLSAGFSVGVEKRKVAGKKTTLYTAPEFDMGFSFGTSNTGNSTYWSLSPGFSMIFGLQYAFNDDWALTIEGGPGGSISVRKFPNNPSTFTLNGYFNSNLALALMHRF